MTTARCPHVAIVQCPGDGTEAGRTRRLQLAHVRLSRRGANTLGRAAARLGGGPV
jgi:hypothetical protein